MGNAIGSKAYVGPDDPPDLSDELLLDPELFGQFGEELWGGDMPEVERRPASAAGLTSSTMVAIWRLRPRVRLKGMISPPAISSTGLTSRAVPRRRCALPMRPLLARYSSVPTAKRTLALR